MEVNALWEGGSGRQKHPALRPLTQCIDKSAPCQINLEIFPVSFSLQPAQAIPGSSPKSRGLPWQKLACCGNVEQKRYGLD